MEARAVLKNIKGSPRKMRMVVDLIRGKEVDEALAILKYNPKHASKSLEKLLLSAISNWEQKNEGARVEDSQLFIKLAYVDGARVLKRWQPAPFGRANRIRKRYNHTTIIVDSKILMEAEAAQPTVETEEPKPAETKGSKKEVKEKPSEPSAKQEKKQTKKKETKKAPKTKKEESKASAEKPGKKSAAKESSKSTSGKAAGNEKKKGENKEKGNKEKK